MTITHFSPAHKYGISTSLKGLKKVDDLHLTRTKVLYYAHGGRILQPLGSSHIGGSIGAVGADKGLNLGFKLLPGRFLLFYLRRILFHGISRVLIQSTDLGNKLLVSAVSHLNGSPRAGSSAIATTLAGSGVNINNAFLFVVIYAIVVWTSMVKIGSHLF